MFALAIHGGAGVIPRPMTEALHAECVAALLEALLHGEALLASGAGSLDVVEAVVRLLEDQPLFNAGRGSVFNHDGEHELDAAVMDGRRLQCGAVAAVRTARNPVTLARAVMEKTTHVLLAGPGADHFAQEAGVECVENTYFSTERRRTQWLAALSKEGGNPLTRVIDGGTRGTVGCVARDVHGHVAAATSTGGLANKRAGRVGDSPLIGAGTYANDQSCAVSCTGTGEQFMRHVVAHTVHQRMVLLGESLERAASGALATLAPGDGGLIAVDAQGLVVMPFNSAGMYRGAADSTGRRQVGIWEELVDV